MQSLSSQERHLNEVLLNLPHSYSNRFDCPAECELRQLLFRSLACQRNDYLLLFFPHGPPSDRSKPWSLQAAQGALDGAEYTAAAKGTACGHIFRSGESTYHCKTCAADDTCVLCARCFDASDHEGHQVFVSVSQGNSGCCDCGDREAWRREVPCTIHTADTTSQGQNNGKDKQPAGSVGPSLPPDLVESIRMTVARAVDFLCDVFSCSPEQMRLPKTEDSVRKDEEGSRLSGASNEVPVSGEIEYALVLWNDEKHTVKDVQNQVARACSATKRFGFEKAMEVHEIGRSIVHYSTDLKELLQMAEIIEHLKVTVTIRSSRDTFRERMCETIIDWIADIAGCSVGSDAHILRNIVCEELLKPWRAGGQAVNKAIGRDGIDDHENEDQERQRRRWRAFIQPFQPGAVFEQVAVEADRIRDNNEDDGDESDDIMMDMEDEEMQIDIAEMHAAAQAALAAGTGDADVEMRMDYLDENEEATEPVGTAFGYRALSNRAQARRIPSPNESDDGDAEPTRRNSTEPFSTVPRTPKTKQNNKKSFRPSKHWLEKPAGFGAPRPAEPCEDLWQRVRLDYLILYDLRLWKTLRINLRHLYITTVVTIPHFKRILGLRFAGLYTALAQLYLIADREPEHSIINLSVQMLTTPTITQEVVERGNFLSNLMAILYTFLTSRQVGFTEDISPKATLAFDAGAVTNRRMFHFFLDLRWLLQSEFILYRMRVEQRYLLQFLDLVKLHQGVCPNVRATGDHVEYESDAWISASMIVKEINKLCKHVGAAFDPKPAAADEGLHLRRAIRTVAQVTLINAYGCERKRFHAAEVKEELKWHAVGPFEASDKRYLVPSGVVQTAPMSFHHPLHYLLSWLIEGAKGLQRDEVRSLLQFSPNDLNDPWSARRTSTRALQIPSHLGPDELISAIFDHPLRVCVWLAQMKAGMWVRNGITLRHQAHTYRGVSHRDVGYQRDIFMVQAGFVLSGSNSERPGERFLAQMVDRFQMEQWVKGDYSILPGFDDMQQIDVFEDLYHLLVIVLSERGNLIPGSNGQEQHDKVLEHDIAHSLCFKPLSFSDLASRVTEKVSESDDFNRVLEHMTLYRAPEGLNDTGTFELKPEFLELVDPYYAHYSRNHREEAESIYKKHIARKTDKKAEEVVYEPHLLPIPSGLFANLSAFTSTPLFTQVVASALKFSASIRTSSTKLQTTRVETFLHMVLHLVLIATIEDADNGESFVRLAALPLNGTSISQPSVVALLVTLSGMVEYQSCHPTIKHILRKMQSRQPEKVGNAIGPLGAFLDRTESSSPASISSEDKERKKQEAKARQARVMAQMKQQQNTFLQNRALSGFDDDFDELDDMSIVEEPENVEHKKTWSFPTGTCILCQEETDDQKLYGTFAFLGESKILRATPVDDLDFVQEVIDTPNSLDRPADELRPFGVAGKNKNMIQKMMPGGKVVSAERQGLSKGFPCNSHGVQGPVATSCGHIMHYRCFDLYLGNSHRRHQQQIARNQPENHLKNEFICPLCKALGNTFLPIIWKAKECAHENELHAAKTMADWLASMESTYLPERPNTVTRMQQLQEFSGRSQQYVNATFAPSLVASMQLLSVETPGSTPASPQRYPRRGTSFSRFWPFNRNEGSQSSIDTTGLGESPDRMSRMAELVKAYDKLNDTIEKNKLGLPIFAVDDAAGNNPGPVNPIPPLSRSLGLSISAFEIAHRGVSNTPLATSVLADLPEQVLTHFRIMSETIESYIAVNNLRLTSNVNNIAGRQIVNRKGVMIEALMGAHNIPNQPVDSDQVDGSTWLRLFEEDIFLFFVDWLTFVAPNVAEASSAMQLCVWAEVVKVVLVYTKVLRQQQLRSAATVPAEPGNQDFANAIHAAMENTRDMHDRLPLSEEQTALLRQIVEKHITAFLRKCIVVMFVRYGLDFECPYDIDLEAPELQRLTALLHMPSLDDMCALYASQSPAGTKLRQLTQRWVYEADDRDLIITVPHPAIFELVGLPKTYDTLTEEAIRRKCPTTGKEITDPAVCLFCGAIFCSQAVCCMKDKNKGGCYQHTQTCGGKVGVFIHIRKCMVLFVHGPGNGSYTHAPYLDKHGEPDPTLRRHHQLFLNQRRYDKLIREVWLQHLIPTVISRKLEADINPGGWETL